MKITIDTENINAANEFGETLRKYFFTKNKGYGCYENFEVEPFLRADYLTESQIEAYFGDIESKCYYFRGMNHEWMAYNWDGDGTLVVSDGKRIAINHDCKKSYNWNFI